MADDKNLEEKKRPRGRPKKQPEDPGQLVNEGAEELRMTDKQGQSQVTLQQVKESLTGLYNNVFSFSKRGKGDGWMDKMDTYNAYNPFLQNQRLKQISTMPGGMSDDEIAEALEAPQAYEQPLRGVGWDLANKQHLYYQILRLAADVPMYNYYKLPPLLEKESDYSSKGFKEEDAYVDEWLETFNPKTTLKRVALETKREGKSTYLLRNSVYKDDKGERHVNYATFQKMPSNYIKLTAIGEHGYIASFDMMLFMNPAFNTSQYPPFIRDIWNDLTGASEIIKVNTWGKYTVDVGKLANYEYKDAEGKLRHGIFESRMDRYLFWVQLPQDLCFTFASDSSHPWAVPDTIGLFQALKELSDYGTLAALVASTPLTAILTGEIETINDPNPGQDQTIMNPQTIAGFQNEFNSKTSTNVEALFVPCKNLKLQSIPNQPSGSDIVTKATQNYIAQSGEGGILVATEKPSVAQVRGAQALEASKQDFVTRQFEDILNMIVHKHLGCQYRWKIFLWGDIYSFGDEFGRDKELWQAGATFLLPKILSAYNMNIRDARASEMYVKSLGIYKELKTLTQETQLAEKKALSNNDKGSEDGVQAQGQVKVSEENKDQKLIEKKSVGRPAKALSEITNENTEASVGSGRNSKDGRMYSYTPGKCIFCGALCENGQIMCEECKEQYLEEEGEV